MNTLFLKNFSIFTLCNLIGASLNFVLLPIFTKYLSPSDYGKLSLFLTFAAFIYPFIMVGINGSINTAYFKTDTKKFPAYFSSAILILSIATVLVFFIFIACKNLFFHYFQLSISYYFLLPLYLFFQALFIIILGIIQIRQDAITFAKLQIGFILSNLSLSLLLIITYKLSWHGRIIGIFISTSIFSILGLFILNKYGYFTRRINFIYIKDILKFGIPLIPHMLSAPLMSMSDRLIMSKYIDMATLGKFNLAFQIGTIISLIALSFNQVWSPRLFSILGNANEKQKKTIVKQSYLFIILLVAIFIALLIALPIIFKLFINNNYSDSIQYVPLIGLGFLFDGMYYLVVNYIFYEKKTQWLAFITFIVSVIRVILNFVLINNFGAIGSAYAHVLCCFLSMIFVWILSNKVYPMPWFSFIGEKK